MRWLKIIGYSLIVLLVLITTFSIVMSSFYEKEIKKYIVEAINEQVNVPINVKDLDFSVLKKFPYASVEFKEVEIASTNHKSPLLKAKSVYFQFNIIDLLNKKYVLKKISIENGSTLIFIDQQGKDNFHFWKTNPESSKQPIAFELSDVQFKNMDLNYLNNYKQQDMGLVVTKMNFSGNFNENNYHLETNIALHINQLNSKNEAFLKDKDITIEGKIEVNKQQLSYKIQSGEISIEELIFKLEGIILDKNEELNLQLSSKGTDVDFATLFSLLPAQMQTSLAAYDAKGVFNYQAQVSGIFSATKTPHVEADFQVKSGNLKEKKSGYELSNIHFSGIYNNGANNHAQTTKLNINDFNADFGAGHISGNYEIANFQNPYIQLTSEANIDIAMAKEFFKLDSLETATGKLILNVEYKGYISNLQKIKASELQQLNAKGNAQLVNTHLKWQSKPYQLINANAYFEFNNNLIKIDSLTTTVNHSPVYISGVFKNLLAYLFVENEKLEVTASFTSPKFMLEDFLLQSSSSNQSEQEVSLPDNITFTFTTQIDTFLFRRFKADHFRGVIQLEDNLLSATDVSFNAMGGHIKGSIALDNENPNELLITSNAKMFDIDITQLFYQFENFGQTALDAENLKGKAAIAVDFASVWDKHLNVNKDKIYVSSTIIIKNGELLDYEPVMALSKFIEVEELKRIKFNQLKTAIEINKQVITIAKTEIQSSAINLTLSGSHHFNNDIDYRVKVDLSEILWDKAKKRKKQNEEFGYVEDDGLGKGTVFLKITGNVKNYKVSYDTEGLKSNMKENIQEEKRTLKSILNKEFGWFKKDTTITKEEPKKKDGLKIEWEEAEDNKTKEDTKKKKESEKKKEKTGLRKFLDKITQPNEEEVEENEGF
jgi:hypothetical protein